jgi:hypothetical protein
MTAEAGDWVGKEIAGRRLRLQTRSTVNDSTGSTINDHHRRPDDRSSSTLLLLLLLIAAMIVIVGSFNDMRQSVRGPTRAL